jgi:hypothetical protein
MRPEIRVLILVIAGIYLSPALAHAQSQQLSDKERARIKEQVDALKNSKLKEAAAANQQVKQDALRKGVAIDQKINQQSEQIDRAAENIGPRFGTDFAKSLGDVRKQELQAKAKAEKEKIANEARKTGATNAGAAKKTVDDIDKSVEGLKSQVSKSGKFGLKPKGSNVYVRNYGGKN